MQHRRFSKDLKQCMISVTPYRQQGLLIYTLMILIILVIVVYLKSPVVYSIYPLHSRNINQIGESPSGLNIYIFEYTDTKNGSGLFQGVMSDEVPQKAVGERDGYDTVDYSLLDVEFKLFA